MITQEVREDVEIIKGVVADHYLVPYDRITIKDQHEYYRRPRQVLQFLINYFIHNQVGLQEIADLTNVKTHSSVLNSLKVIQREGSVIPRERMIIQELIEKTRERLNSRYQSKFTSSNLLDKLRNQIKGCKNVDDPEALTAYLLTQKPFFFNATNIKSELKLQNLNMVYTRVNRIKVNIKKSSNLRKIIREVSIEMLKDSFNQPSNQLAEI